MHATGYLFHEAFLEHRTGPRHPERAARLTAINDHLQQCGTWSRLTHIEPRPATSADIAMVHASDYISRLEQSEKDDSIFTEDQDTVGSPGTWRAALLAAGAVMTAADAIVERRITNAFCAVRPPGHHALSDHGMGFCFFNNVAIGARHLQRRHGIERIAIIDWDVHHGNGTQAMFYDDPSVLYCSIHQFPHYPNSGRQNECGTGRGQGFTLNLPVAIGSTDGDYLRLFAGDLGPKLRFFNPQFILISAGFDAGIADPLGGVLVTPAGFAAMTRMVCAWAATFCEKKVISVLEGGYDLGELGINVAAHIDALLEEQDHH